MSKQATPIYKPDGRKAPRPYRKIEPKKPAPLPTKPEATLESLMALFDAPSSPEPERPISLASVRFQLVELIQNVAFMDQPSIDCDGERMELPAEALSEALNGIAKAARQFRDAVPGLFLKEPSTPLEQQQAAIARWALARYVASVDGGTGMLAVLQAFRQVDALTKGNGGIYLPAAEAVSKQGGFESRAASQFIALGEASLLDRILPQWRDMGRPDWVSPLRRYRGNWVDQTYISVYTHIANHLMLLFRLRGWSLEHFSKDRAPVKRRYFEAFQQTLVLAGKPRLVRQALYPHLDTACLWAESEEARRMMASLVEMDPTRIRDEQRVSRQREKK